MGKVAGQWVTFRASARIGAIAASLAAAAALLLPTAALAGTTTEIGSAAVGSFTCPLFAPVDSVQLTSSGKSYAVPAGGTSITSWSVTAAAGDVGPVGLEVWQPSAGIPIPATLIATSSPLQTLSPGLNTFTTAIPVQPGDLIGLRLEGPLSCMAPILDATGFPIPGNTVGYISGPVVTTFTGFQLNIAASVDVAAPPSPITIPTSTDQCKHGGWQALTDTNGTPFKNQGDCVSFVATDATNAGNGPPADATNAGNGPPADATNAGNGPPADATNAGNGPPA